MPRAGRGGRGWQPEEEAKLQAQVQLHGQKSWSLISRSLPGRTGKQCRERYLNHLRPDIKRQSWTSEEELVLAEGHARLGTRWSSLVHLLPGRTENQIKNHWNATLRCKGRLRAGAREGPDGSQRNGVLREYHAALAEGRTRGSALGLAASVLLVENKASLSERTGALGAPVERSRAAVGGGAEVPTAGAPPDACESGEAPPQKASPPGGGPSPESTKTGMAGGAVDYRSEGVSAPQGGGEEAGAEGPAAGAPTFSPAGRDGGGSAGPQVPTPLPPAPAEGQAKVAAPAEAPSDALAAPSAPPSGDAMTETRVSAPPLAALEASEPSPAYKTVDSNPPPGRPFPKVEASADDRVHVFQRPISSGDLSEFTKHAHSRGGHHIASYTGLSSGEELLPPSGPSLSAAEQACVSLCRSARGRWEPTCIVVAVCAGKYAAGEVCSTIIVAAKSSQEAFGCLSHLTSVYREAVRGALENLGPLNAGSENVAARAD